jgi:hypothetical protein
MTIKAIVSTAMLASLSMAIAIPVDAATKKRTKVEQQQSRTIYYRQSDPGYYAPPGSRQARRYLVQPRSYLSAGTQTKQHEEHYADYAFPPGQSWDYQNRNSAQGSFTRMPLADPWDIPGWPKY